MGLAVPVIPSGRDPPPAGSNPMPMAAPPENRTRPGFLLVSHEILSSLKSAKSQFPHL